MEMPADKKEGNAPTRAFCASWQYEPQYRVNPESLSAAYADAMEFRFTEGEIVLVQSKRGSNKGLTPARILKSNPDKTYYVKHEDGSGAVETVESHNVERLRVKDSVVVLHGREWFEATPGN